MVEEAAETLEPLVLASLPPTAERLIMIGDHQQLRPKVQSYKLQASYFSTSVTFSLPSMLRLMCSCRLVHLSTHMYNPGQLYDPPFSL
jgi:superfamily I DNA and/or RNA helicase